MKARVLPLSPLATTWLVLGLETLVLAQTSGSLS